MNTITEQPVTLRISRLIKAPRERVFAAWTKANEFAQWLGSGPRRIVSAQIDLQVGGEYRLDLISEEHGEMNFKGEYREITPPQRLVFTWAMGNCIPDHKDAQTLVTVELKEHKDGTLLELTHEGFPTSDIRDRHDKGWNASLDDLEKLV